MQTDYLDTDQLAEIFLRLQNLENAQPNRSGSVSQGRLRFNGVECILIDGSGSVEGTLTVQTGGQVAANNGAGSVASLSVTPSGAAGIWTNSGSTLEAMSAGIALFNPDRGGNVYTDDASTTLNFGGTNLYLDGAGVHINSEVYLTGLPTISGVMANLFVDPGTGYLSIAE